MLSVAQRISAALFQPIRQMAGPLHRRRHSLSDDQQEHERGRAALGAEWPEKCWYPADFPPRNNNAIIPLIDGDNFLRDLYSSLSTANSRVTIAGWCLTPGMPLLRGDAAHHSLLVDVLREVSERAEVLILLWAGAPGFFQPTTQVAKGVRSTFAEKAPRVRCRLDYNASFSHDHHQKAITIDGRVAYVGGMDLTTFEGDRWDTPDHSLRHGPNWHDVQLRVMGEVVQDVEANFIQRWQDSGGESLGSPAGSPEAIPDGGVRAQVVRTVPPNFYRFTEEGYFGIRHALLAAIQDAKQFIYLENQYLWAPEIVEALIEAMNSRRERPFRIVVVLPARAMQGRYDNDEHVRQLQEADDGRGIFRAYTPYTAGPAIGMTGHAYLPVYVHAKVSIVDDYWLCVGSANLNRRGLATDTEIAIQAIAPSEAKALRLALWSEHLMLSRDDLEQIDVIDAIDLHWPETAERMQEALRAGSPPPNAHALYYKPDVGIVGRFLDVVQSSTLEH